MLITDVSTQYTLTVPPSTGRTTGVWHVSTLVYNAAIAYQLLDAEDKETGAGVPQFSPEATARICAGLAWEQWYLQRLPGVTAHPGELQRDNVFGTPDGVNLRTFPRVIHEVKLTWKSIRHAITDARFWMYLAQLKAYCYMCGTSLAVLHIYAVNGDYRGFIPQTRVYELVFTELELIENWELLMQFKTGVPR